MTEKVITINTQPGIRRDGTVLDGDQYSDGLWVRFQRGRPRKILGVKRISNQIYGPTRGMFVDSNNGINNIFTSYASGIQVIGVDNNGVGAGVSNFTFTGPVATLGSITAGSGYTNGTYNGVPMTGGTGTGLYCNITIAGGAVTSVVITTTGPLITLGAITGGAAYTNGTYTNVPLTGGLGSGAIATITVAAGAVTTVSLTDLGAGYTPGDVLSAAAANIGGTGAGFSVPVATITVAYTQSGVGYTVGNTLSASATNLGGTVTTAFSIPVATISSVFTASADNVYQFDSSYDSQGGVNQLLVHPGQNLAQVDSTTNTPVLYGAITGTTLTELRDVSGPEPTGDIVSVSGGVVALHPYIFVYGNSGLIKNNSKGNPLDWNSTDANEVNVATGKIVKGLPVRGGTNAPSGLFWSLDSLIRVSYIGAPDYWRYDIITSQSSILSSSGVIEYDGIYYWCGVDRFLMYNGVVQEIPNPMNQNWFFDDLNYTQRQKVWAWKVPRYGEIWWFYPRGSATECTDAIIYNVREKTWYDAGQSIHAQRSSGYFSQVFRYPVAGGTEDIGSGYTKLWQHEVGVDVVDGASTSAIDSYFTTHDLSWVTGNPAQEAPTGENFWSRLERVEPDFLQDQEMTMYIIGRPYAQAADVTTGPYAFDSSTTKIDLKEQRRELRLKFESNIIGGDYQMGRILLSLDMGDVRGYTP
jgi:hypothetical protein